MMFFSTLIVLMSLAAPGARGVIRGDKDKVRTISMAYSANMDRTNTSIDFLLFWSNKHSLSLLVVS